MIWSESAKWFDVPQMTEQRHYVLWGSSGHARVLDEAIQRLGGRVVALFDNAPDAVSAVPGAPLVGGLEALPSWAERTPFRREMFALVAIGGARARERLALQRKLADIGLSIEALIHPAAFVASTATIAAGTQVLAMAVVAAEANIGEGCIINHKASVDHECKLADGVHVAPGATLCGCVTVGEHAMIGAGAVVLPRLRIGHDSIVGAGAVVTHDVPDGAVVSGNPARITRYVSIATE